MKRTALLYALLSFFFLPAGALAQKEKETKMIQNGSVVSIEYILSDDQGEVIESNKGEKPLTYTHGSGQIIPGLEKGLAGMKVNDEKKVEVKPEEGYGSFDPNAVGEVPREQIPPEAQKTGTTLVAKNAQGNSFPVKVHEIKEKTVVLDFNHPLAGKTLNFDVKVLDIQESPAK